MKKSIYALFLACFALVSCNELVEVIESIDFPVVSVSLSEGSLNLPVGEQATLTAKIFPSNASDQSVAWSSDNDAVASVKDGLVSGISEGTANITVTTNDGGKTATCKVTVYIPVVSVTSVSLDKESAELFVGETVTLTATVLPEDADDKSVTWASDDEAVATVADGVVTAVAEGYANIIVTTNDGGYQASCGVKVSKKSAPMVKMEYERLADLNTARSSFPCFVCGDEIVAAGGHYGSFSPSGTAEYYSGGSWTEISMNYSHDNGAYATLQDGRVLVMGGCSGSGGTGRHKNVDIYDPATHSFSAGYSMYLERALLHALTLGNGNVLVAGNWYGSDSIEEYSASTGKFSELKSAAQSRSYPYLLKTSASNAIVFGYYGNYGGRNNPIQIDRYDGDAYTVELFDTWHPMSMDANWSADHIFIGDESAGDYRYLLPLFQGNDGGANATAYALGIVKGEEITLAGTDYDIPMYGKNGNKLCYKYLIADNSKKVAYWFASDMDAIGSINDVTCSILKIDYSGLDSGEPLKLILYYTDTIDSFNCGSQGGCAILSDGRLMVTGGIYNSNYQMYNYTYAFKPF